ncbi:MAG: hypothetical protein J0M34_02860 [Alphaproteobacteria bacterium]|nr:hypothetical protein [Alphaproteobacteria bacterium]
MSKKFKRRSKIEVIVDSNCAGGAVLDGVNKLITYATEGGQSGNTIYKPIFSDYRIVLPIQIGTETRRRVFPEFLEAEIRAKAQYLQSAGKPVGALETFFLQHSEGDEDLAKENKHMLVVENEVSRAYKLFFAGKAAALLANNDEATQRIANGARYLAERYGIDISDHSICPSDVHDFCHRVRETYEKHVEHFADTESKIREQNSKFNINDLTVDMVVASAQRENLARKAKKFFADCSPQERCIMQAMYSDRELYNAVSDDDAFERFRRDQGERSVERYLIAKSNDYEQDRVTLVITKDTGALRGVEYVRKMGAGHSIIGLSPYGLGLALEELGVIEDSSKIAGQDSLDAMERRRAKAERHKSLGYADALLPQPNHPDHEAKWAHRLSEVMRWGDYEDRIQKRSKRESGSGGSNGGGVGGGR